MIHQSLPSDVLVGLATPCLVVHLEAADRNIARAAAFFATRTVRLRPHFKAHKCTVLLRRQVAAGHCVGVTCATAWEADVLARQGFDDILVANQVVDPHGLERVARAAARARVTVTVDDEAQVSMLQTIADRRGVRLGVLIEIDVGMRRCGLPADDPRFLVVATKIAATSRLYLRGLMGYEGHAVFKINRTERGALVNEAAAILRRHRERLERAGLPCPVVSGGGTGTYDLATDAGAVTEVQLGSYALMDARYRTIGLPFEVALYCCARILSRPRPDQAVLNVGLKSLSVEYGMPLAARPDLQIIRLSDEHAVASLDPRSPLQVGDPVLLIPSHVDPTVNLHSEMFVWSGARDFEVWQVDGRRA